MRTRISLVASLMLAVLAWPLGAQAPPGGGKDAKDTSAGEYTIGIEDVLRIVVWNEPELSGPVKVRPDGMITLPLVHDVKADGLTPEEVRTLLTQRLSTFIRDPDVTVIVDTINSYRIYLIGEVNTPGSLNLYRPLRVLQAVAMAGGPTEFSKKIIVLLREEYGVEKRIEIDYRKLLAGDPEQENLYLRPGDTLIFK